MDLEQMIMLSLEKKTLITLYFKMRIFEGVFNQFSRSFIVLLMTYFLKCIWSATLCTCFYHLESLKNNTSCKIEETWSLFYSHKNHLYSFLDSGNWVTDDIFHNHFVVSYVSYVLNNIMKKATNRFNCKQYFVQPFFCCYFVSYSGTNFGYFKPWVFLKENDKKIWGWKHNWKKWHLIWSFDPVGFNIKKTLKFDKVMVNWKIHVNLYFNEETIAAFVDSLF